MDYEQCRVPSNRENYPLDLPTYYQRLREAGYRVCGVGKFDLHKDLAHTPAERDWHLDGSRSLKQWGFTEGIDNEGKLDGSASYRAAGRPRGPYLRYLHELRLADQYVEEHAQSKHHRDAYITALSEEAYCDNWVSENGLRFLEGFPRGQPWHLVVNFTGPHNPMDVTQRMHDEWKDVAFPPPVGNDQADYSSDDHQRNRRHYAAMIENIDRQIGRFLDAVRQRGDLDNTMVVYASDHGEMLGDHSRWGKGTWYTASSGIPLIVAGPSIQHGRVSCALVSLHDLTATFLDYAGAEALPAMESRSLRGVLEARTEEHRQHVFSGLGDWRMAFDGRYKLVLRREDPDLLYDTLNDPNEMQNVADRERSVVERLRGVCGSGRDHDSSTCGFV
jgi:arylsulfatase A-like enzyme